MIPVSQDYSNYLSSKSFSPYSKIIVDGVSYLGNVLKTFPKIKHQSATVAGGFPAKTVSFEIYDQNNNLDFEDKEIEVYKGFLIDDEVEYVKQGVFIPRAENITRNISNKVIKFEDVQDRTQLLENSYKSELDYSNGRTHTGLEIVQEICTNRNITLLNNNFAFANYNFPQPNFNETITEREVISRLAEIGGETVFFNYEGQLTIKGQTNTNITIPRSRYEKLSKEKVITYNTVVLGKEGMDDDIVYPSDMSQDDRVPFKIFDNPYVDLIRESIISEVASHIIGLSYIPSELSGFIDGFIFELNDYVTVNDRNNTSSKFVILDYESTSRYKSNVKCKFDVESQETNYELAGSNRQSINNVRLSVNHIQGTVESVVNQTVNPSNPNSVVNKMSSLTQTVDQLTAQISDISDITTSGESNVAFDLNNVNESEPIMIKIHPTTTNISYLYPRDNLYPSDTLYMPDRKIRFYNNTTSETIEYTLPDDLLIYDNTHYDEFYLDNESQTCQIIKRCKYNADGTVGLLSSERTDDYSTNYPEIHLTTGNYTISMPGYSNCYVFARLMATNIYTAQFYTKVETNSKINQSANSITASVNQTLTNYSTTTQMNSAITLKANEINSTVSTKVGNDEIISKINQSAESVTVNASKINVSGVVTAINGGSTTIDGSKITTGTITANQINSSAITSTKIASGAITTEKLSANCVDATKVASDVITTNNFSAQNINANKITSGTLSTDRLASDVITTSNLSAQSISADRITSGTLSVDRLSAGSISGTKIASATITGSNIADATITNGKIANATITSAKISSLNAGKITTGSLTSSNVKIGSWSLNGSGILSSNAQIYPDYLGYKSGGSGGWVSCSWWRIGAAGTSDKRLKKDIKLLDKNYDNFFDELKPICFKWKAGNNKNHIGFVAQDMQKAIEENNLDLDIIYQDEQQKYLRLEKQEIIALNTWQIQKLKQENKELKNALEELKEEIQKMKEER